jgi:zinc protease
MKYRRIFERPKALILSIALLLVASLPFSAAAMQGKPPKTAVAEKKLFDYQQIELANGLDVITLEDFSTPIVAVQVWYHVGSKNEDPNRQGFAHMFEHMMFKGTDRVGENEFFDLIRQVGGSANGYTSFDRTVYLETVPANQIELALWLEAERMAFLKIDQHRFDTERKVVEEERRMHLDEPYGTLVEKVLPDIFSVSPYRWMPIGKIPQLRAASVEELRAFWEKYYVPSNATLIIVGAVHHQEAQKLAEKYFGWIPKYPVPPRINIKEPLPTKPRTIMIEQDNAPAPLVGVVYRAAPVSSDDDIPLTLLAQILGEGHSSRLYRELVAQKQLAVNVIAEDESLQLEGLFIAGAMLPPAGSDPNAVLAIIQKQIERLRTEPVSEHELTKARNQMLKQFITSTLTVDHRASMLGQAAVDEGNVAKVNERYRQVQTVTADDLLRVAKKYLVPERVLIVKVPENLPGIISATASKSKNEEDGKITAVPEKVTPPPGRDDVKRPSDWPPAPPLAENIILPQTPKYSEHKLANGLKVIVVPKHEVPFVSIQLGFLAGSWTETKPGTASMAMKMLTKGTAKHTEGQLADELETYAIALGGRGEMDSSSVVANCITDQLGRAMNLMAEVVLTPTFPPEEFTKLRKQVLASLAVSSEEPDYKAEKEYRRVLYGNFPYARTDTGEVNDVEALNIEDQKQWYGTFARPDCATLIFAGDIDDAKAFQLAKTAFGDWRVGTAKPETKLPPIPKVEGRHIYLVNFTGIQSQIRLGQHSITRHDPEYFTSRVVNDYFGLGFNSRLNETIRVAKGLTYDIYGGYIAKRFAGEFMISTFSKTASAADAIKAVLAEIDRLKSVPPTKDEVAKSRSYIVGSFLERRETPQQIADDLWLIESNGLPTDYFEKLLAAVSKTDPNDCMKLVKRTVDPNNMVIAVIGDANAVKGDLEKIAPVIMAK